MSCGSRLGAGGGLALLMSVALAQPGCSPTLEPGPLLQLGAADYSVWVQTGVEPRIELRRGGEVLLELRADGIQLGTVGAQLDPHKSYDPYWLDAGQDVLAVDPPPELAWHRIREIRPGDAAPPANQLRLELVLEDGLRAQLTIEQSSSGRFAASVVPLAPEEGAASLAVAYVRLRGHLTGDENEGLYGLGEWADEVNHRGRVRPMQLEIDTLESANNENRVPVPLLLGTRGWGLFVESKRVGSFDVAHKQADAVEATFGTAEQSAQGLRFHLFAAEQPLDLLRRYYDVTGDPLLPAAWAYGPWIWRNESRDQAQVLDDIAKIRSLDLATSAIWIDRPYSDYVNTFNFSASRYPDPRQMIATAHAAGLRVAVWHAPYLEEKAQPYRAEADSKGYFPPASGLLLNNWSQPIDFTNPAAFAAWQGWLKKLTDLGVEGFKLDYGEDIAPGYGDARNNWRFADGSDERTGHYEYTLAYHRLYSEMVPSAAAGGGFLLCRAGRWGDQKHVSVIWPGDMDATFTKHRETFMQNGKSVDGVGGLPATVVQGLSLSASGFPFFASDTGGYRHSPPDKELFIRWFEQTALAAVMEIGDQTSQTPWEFTSDNGRDAQTLELYRRYTRLHLRLFPYAWSYAQRLHTDGRPLVRPFGLAYPDAGVHPADQYLFGEDLLVAPVLSRGATSRQVLLPSGRWLDFWDGTAYQGPAKGAAAVTVPAPIERLPLLVREGALVPMLRPNIDTLSPATDANVESFANDAGALSVLVVPGAAMTTFALYDGTVLAQGPDPGAGAAGKGYALSMQPGALFQHGALFQILGEASPAQVLLDGQKLAEVADLDALEKAPAGFAHTAGPAPTLWVKVPPSSVVKRVLITKQ